MIQLATFGLNKKGIAEFNKFVEKNSPRSTEKQSGIIFHTDYVVVVYDDGRESPDERTGELRSLFEGARKKKLLVDLKLEQAKFALDEMKPKGYAPSLTDNQLRKLVEDEIGPDLGSKDKYETSKRVLNEIINLQNTILMDTHESRRIGYEIEAYKKLLNQ